MVSMLSFRLYNECMGDKQSATTSITIRIPAEIAEQMRRVAKQHDRSLNGEIVRALREYVAKHQEKQEYRNSSSRE